MYRYTTPTLTVRVEGIDLTPYDCTVSLRQTIRRAENSHTVDVELSDLTLTVDGSDTLVAFTLTQEQSGGFADGWVDVQVNYGSGAARMATEVASVEVERNLLNGAVEFAAASDPDTTVEEVAVTIGTMPPLGSITSDYLASGAVTADKLDITLGYAVTDGDLTITIS